MDDKDMPIVSTVGDLREALSKYSDDMPFSIGLKSSKDEIDAFDCNYISVEEVHDENTGSDIETVTLICDVSDDSDEDEDEDEDEDDEDEDEDDNTDDDDDEKAYG